MALNNYSPPIEQMSAPRPERVRNYQSWCCQCCQRFADNDTVTISVHRCPCAFAPSTRHCVSAGCLGPLEPPGPPLGERRGSRNLHPPGVRPYLDNLKHCFQRHWDRYPPPCHPAQGTRLDSASLLGVSTRLTSLVPDQFLPGTFFNNLLSFGSLSQHLISEELNLKKWQSWDSNTTLTKSKIDALDCFL